MHWSKKVTDLIPTRVLRIFVLAAFSLFAFSAPAVSPVVASGSPCDNVPNSPPGPPTGPDVPLVAGDITDASTGNPITNASVELYQCATSGDVLISTVQTDTNGAYSISGLSAGYYYVQALYSGPLSGKSPAGATQNPSALIEVGDGDGDLGMSFQ